MQAMLTPSSTVIRTPAPVWPSDEKLVSGFLAQGMSREGAEARVEDLKKQRERIKPLAREFEANFVSMLIEEMKKSVDKNDMFHGGFGEDVFESMLSLEQARQMSFAGEGLGLSRLVESGLATKLLGRPGEDVLPESPIERGLEQGIREPFGGRATPGERALDAPVGILDSVRNAMALSGMAKTYRASALKQPGNDVSDIKTFGGVSK